MIVSIRADASLQIGTGHVMRCLTLASALAEKDARCRFVCREHPGNLLELIRDRGFEAFGLPVGSGRVLPDASSDMPAGEHAAWLGTDCVTDAKDTQFALSDRKSDWLIVDHYALDARWERLLRSASRHVMVIDDLADRAHDCDLLLDQNLGRVHGDYARLVPKHCAVLVGPSYALMRPEFEALREYSLQRRSGAQCRRILISMGGVDKSNATGRVLETLKTCSLPENCEIVVVMGRHAPCLGQVRSLAARMPRATNVLVDVNDMAQVMADSDLAIGAAGVTSWERCCLGLPALIAVLAENQRESAKALEETGAALLIGGIESIESGLRAGLGAVSHPNKLSAMSRACGRVTDGRGTSRVISKIFEHHDQ